MNIESAISTPQELRARVKDADASDPGSITDDMCNAELRRLAPLVADLWEAAQEVEANDRAWSLFMPGSKDVPEPAYVSMNKMTAVLAKLRDLQNREPERSGKVQK